MTSLLPLIVILVIFGLLLFGPMRRQRRLAAEARTMRAALGPGDQIMTTSGLYGTITAMDDDSITLEIAPGVSARFTKAAIGQRVDPSTQSPFAQPGLPAGGTEGTATEASLETSIETPDETYPAGTYADDIDASAPRADSSAGSAPGSTSASRPDGEWEDPTRPSR